MVTHKKNLFLFGSLGLVIFGIIVVSIIDRVTSSNSGPTDTRARAGVTKNLTVNATVVSSDPIKGTIVVTDVYFTDESRSGNATNFGSWLVTAPVSFNFSTISPGASIVIGVEAISVKIADHTLTATTITVKQ